MFCKIADLYTEVPAAGDLLPRCREYICSEEKSADIIIRTELFGDNLYKDSLTDDEWIYLKSGAQFYIQLLKQSGLMLHSSAVELDGRAFLFSGNCGAGKSTHTRLWQSVFAEKARIFNDDKPALRFNDGRWIAYGTPWCGKDSININMCAPVAGICFMVQAEENRIRRLTAAEAVQRIIAQTHRQFYKTENLDLMLKHVDNLIRHIPVFELENRPEPEAALLSYETMRCAAEEMGL